MSDMSNVHFVRRLHHLLSGLHHETLPMRMEAPHLRTLVVPTAVWQELGELQGLVAAWLAALEATQPAEPATTIEPVTAERARAISEMLRRPSQQGSP